MRDCLADITIDGVTIPAGVKVGFGLASANRDERTYDDPDEFRLDRPSAKDHLAFGGGPHVCPGASLARLEGRSRARRVLRSCRSSATSTTATDANPYPCSGPTALGDCPST